MIDADIKMMAMLQLLDNDFRATIILLQRAVTNVLETTIKEKIKSLSKEIKSLQNNRKYKEEPSGTLEVENIIT